MRKRIARRRSRNTRVKRRKKGDRISFPHLSTPVLLKIGGLFLIFLILIFLADRVTRFVSLPEIPITEVRFEGHGDLNLDELLNKVDLRPGANILRINLLEIRNSILTEPFVKDAEVRRNINSGELKILIELRKPVALLSSNGLYGIDEDRVLLGPVEELPVHGLPLITGIELKNAKPGLRVFSENLECAFDVLNIVSASGLESVAILSEVNVRNLKNVILYVGEDGTHIELGGDEFREKVGRLTVILSELEREGRTAASIDFSFGVNPFVKYKK